LKDDFDLSSHRSSDMALTGCNVPLQAGMSNYFTASLPSLDTEIPTAKSSIFRRQFSFHLSFIVLLSIHK